MKNKMAIQVTTIVLSVLLSVLVNCFLEKDGVYNSNLQQSTQTVNLYTDSTAKININTATKEELKTLPYIGEELANKIMEARPYSNVWEISNVEGVGEMIFNELVNRIEV